MFFKKKKSNETENKTLKQDLTQKEKNDRVFIIHLLMKEKCKMPPKEKMLSIAQKHLGEETECFCYNSKSVGFASHKYKIQFKEGVIPPQLLVMECMSMDSYNIDDLTKSQMWDCKNSAEILAECKYHVIATDILGSTMDYKERAEMLMNYMEALIEMYPECEAILFQTSGKLFTREQIKNHKIPRNERFIYFAVNIRFFNIENSNEKIIDTLGMNILGLPDLQYHFHDFNPNYIVNHAYDTAYYIFENNNLIKNGETVDGISEGEFDRNVQWECHYEQSLIQPVREVIDICMNEYAGGKRTY